MADAGLFIGWGNPVRGRERTALAVFGEAIEFYTQLQQEGQIESFEAVFLEPHGGDLGGFFLVRGSREQLAKIRTTEGYDRLNARADLIVESFGVVGAALGPGIDAQMGFFQQAIDDLT
jgi:hypothetical protein